LSTFLEGAHRGGHRYRSLQSCRYWTPSVVAFVVYLGNTAMKIARYSIAVHNRTGNRHSIALGFPQQNKGTSDYKVRHSQHRFHPDTKSFLAKQMVLAVPDLLHKYRPEHKGAVERENPLVLNFCWRAFCTSPSSNRLSARGEKIERSQHSF